MTTNSSVNKIAQDLNKKYERTMVHPASKVPPVEKIPWEIPAVDYVTGGGCPINRMIEIYGPESSGKSYLAYLMIAKFQHFDWNSRTSCISSITYKPKKVAASTVLGGYEMMEVDKILVKKSRTAKTKVRLKTAVLIDHEGSYDPVWGQKLGINNDGLLHIQPERGSQAIDIIERYLYDENVSLIVVDSVGSISSDAEIDNPMEKDQMGKNPTLWNKAMRKFTAAMNANPERDITIILINRAYEAVGFVLGNPERLGGGTGIKFAKSMSIRVQAYDFQKDANDNIKGRNVKVKNMKNKTSRPHLESSYYYSFIDDDYVKASQTDIPEQLISLGIQMELISRSGSRFTFNKFTENGRENFKEQLVETGKWKELRTEVYKKIRNEE